MLNNSSVQQCICRATYSATLGGWQLPRIHRSVGRSACCSAPGRQAHPDALSGLPHGARGFQILVTVTESEPPTQAALAAHLGIDRTVLTYVLDDLVDAGLLERKIDASDRRVRRLVATAAGAQLLKASEKKVAEAEGKLFAGLTADEQATLRTLLDRAAAQIHQRDPGHDACSAVADILAAAGPGAAEVPRATDWLAGNRCGDRPPVPHAPRPDPAPPVAPPIGGADTPDHRRIVSPQSATFWRAAQPVLRRCCSIRQTRSRENGVSYGRTPTARRIALPKAGATGLYGLSLIDLAPNGPRWSLVSAK